MTLPSAAEIAAALSELDAIEEGSQRVTRPAMPLIPCWLCWQRVPACTRPDCCRRDQARVCPEILTEGKSR